uniref:Uncharacterized protein n=1 Tax=Anguilla anguilla TaxID=7936 RepID=A0A0E9Q0F1_ANGAN
MPVRVCSVPPVASKSSNNLGVHKHERPFLPSTSNRCPVPMLGCAANVSEDYTVHSCFDQGSVMIFSPGHTLETVTSFCGVKVRMM